MEYDDLSFLREVDKCLEGIAEECLASLENDILTELVPVPTADEIAKTTPVRLKQSITMEPPKPVAPMPSLSVSAPPFVLRAPTAKKWTKEESLLF